MASDFNKPVVSQTKVTVLQQIRENEADLAKMFESTSASNIATGAKQLGNDLTVKRYDGATFNALGYLLPASVTAVQTTVGDPGSDANLVTEQGIREGLNAKASATDLSTHTGLTGTSVHGLGDSSTKNVGTSAGTVSAGDHTHSDYAKIFGCDGGNTASGSAVTATVSHANIATTSTFSFCCTWYCSADNRAGSIDISGDYSNGSWDIDWMGLRVASSVEQLQGTHTSSGSFNMTLVTGENIAVVFTVSSGSFAVSIDPPDTYTTYSHSCNLKVWN